MNRVRGVGPPPKPKPPWDRAIDLGLGPGLGLVRQEQGKEAAEEHARRRRAADALRRRDGGGGGGGGGNGGDMDGDDVPPPEAPDSLVHADRSTFGGQVPLYTTNRESIWIKTGLESGRCIYIVAPMPLISRLIKTTHVPRLIVCCVVCVAGVCVCVCVCLFFFFSCRLIRWLEWRRARVLSCCSTPWVSSPREGLSASRIR